MKRKLEIIFAIALKDSVDSFKNRAFLSIFIGVGFLLLANFAMPLVMNTALDPLLVILDEGQSNAVEGLKKDVVKKVSVENNNAFEQVMSESLSLTLGAVIPEDFDRQLMAGNELTIRAFYMSWESSANLEKMVIYFEDKLSEAFGKEVLLEVEGNQLYPPVSTKGKAATKAMSLVLVLVIFSMVPIPFFIQDEKERKTMDVLLVSPATMWHIILGKAIAGFAFGAVAATLVLFFSHAYIQLWGIAVLSSVAGILFAVSAGLLMGVLFDSAQNMGIVMGLFMTVLFLPVILMLTSIDLPAWLTTILTLIPTDKLAQNFLISFGDQHVWGKVFINLGVLAAFSGIFISLAVWHIKKSLE